MLGCEGSAGGTRFDVFVCYGYDSFSTYDKLRVSVMAGEWVHLQLTLLLTINSSRHGSRPGFGPRPRVPHFRRQASTQGEIPDYPAGIWKLLNSHQHHGRSFCFFRAF